MVLPKSKSLRSSHPWIDSTRFESTEQTQVLEKILERVRHESQRHIESGGKPIKVVFDLDSTIFDVKPRTLRILKEFAATADARAIAPQMADWAMALESYQLAYTLRDTAKANNFYFESPKAEEFLKTLHRFWRQRFFSNAYLYMDHPAPGAQDYVRAVIDAGAIAVYLTGRDEPGMGRGTRAALKHWGFPTSERHTRLVMKPNFGVDDSEFKDSALQELRIRADAVAFFDNEPANFYVFEKNFPSAIMVFFHSNCSEKEAKPIKSAYRIENFLL